MVELIGWLRKGVGELVRQAGLQLMSLLRDKAHRTGLLRSRGAEGANRTPRMRSIEDQEIRLDSYEMLHRGEPLAETVREKLMLRLSTRRYGPAVREFIEAYGLEKSAVSAPEEDLATVSHGAY